MSKEEGKKRLHLQSTVYLFDCFFSKMPENKAVTSSVVVVSTCILGALAEEATPELNHLGYRYLMSTYYVSGIVLGSAVPQR